MLFVLCTVLQSTHQLTFALNKIYSEETIKLLYVSAPGCHHQGVLQNKAVTRPTAKLCTLTPAYI